MKVLLVAAVVCCFALIEAGKYNKYEKKPHKLRGCVEDKDCRKKHCCVDTSLFNLKKGYKFPESSNPGRCLPEIEEGDRCHSAYPCGCEKGTKCMPEKNVQLFGLITYEEWTCQEYEGSGDM